MELTRSEPTPLHAYGPFLFGGFGEWVGNPGDAVRRRQAFANAKADWGWTQSPLSAF
jgi:hypothetical protein